MSREMKQGLDLIASHLYWSFLFSQQFRCSRTNLFIIPFLDSKAVISPKTAVPRPVHIFICLMPFHEVGGLWTTKRAPQIGRAHV